MKIVPTTNSEDFMVSNQDFEFVNQWKWQARIDGSKIVSINRCDKNNKVFILAHEILKFRGINFKWVIDHKDRNVLNNQFENLRPATRAQNQMNQGLRSDNTTGFKGVSYNRRDFKFRAQISIRGQITYLGSFKTMEEAAKMYDRAAKLHFGDFAFLNFPEET